MSTIALHLTFNISETVTDRGFGIFSLSRSGDSGLQHVLTVCIVARRVWKKSAMWTSSL